MPYKDLDGIDLDFLKEGVKGVVVWSRPIDAKTTVYEVEIFLDPKSVGDGVITIEEKEGKLNLFESKDNKKEWDKIKNSKPNLLNKYS